MDLKCFGESGDERTVDAIGLSRLAFGLGKLPNLHGLNDDDGEFGDGAGVGQLPFIAPGGFHDDALWLKPAAAMDKALYSVLRVLDLKVFLVFEERDIEERLTDVDTDIQRFCSDVFRVVCLHDSPLLHSGSRPFRLFEFELESVGCSGLLTGSSDRRLSGIELPNREPAATGSGLTLIARGNI